MNILMCVVMTNGGIPRAYVHTAPTMLFSQPAHRQRECICRNVLATVKRIRENILNIHWIDGVICSSVLATVKRIRETISNIYWIDGVTARDVKKGDRHASDE